MPRPILTVATTSRFTHSFKKLPDSIKAKAMERERVFRADATEPSLRTHKLKGPLKSFWSWSIDFNHRVLFEFTGKSSALCHDVGTHAVYD